MSERIFTTLGDVLRNAGRYSLAYGLYLPAEADWQLDTRCALFDVDEEELNEDDEPIAAAEAGLSYALLISTVQDIDDNLRQQTDSPSDALLLEAFLHYYDHDAFMSVAIKG